MFIYLFEDNPHFVDKVRSLRSAMIARGGGQRKPGCVIYNGCVGRIGPATET